MHKKNRDPSLSDRFIGDPISVNNTRTRRTIQLCVDTCAEI